MRVGVVGATGYTGAELIRLLLRHPRLDLVAVVSHSRAGCRLDLLHPGLLGCSDLVAESFDPVELAKLDAVFLAVPHGSAASLAQALDEAGAPLIIDLSNDHRHAEGWVYGLAEWSRSELSGAKRIAVPGCFATAMSMACAPFVEQGGVVGPVRVVAATGSTGLGATAKKAGHHPERFTNMKAYKVLVHQHRPEVTTFLKGLGPFESLHFVSISAPVDRGILATCFLSMNEPMEPEEAMACLEQAYADEPLVRIRDVSPELRHVRGTGYCDLGCYAEGGDVVVIAAIDNLVKGAAGQAVQCLNLAADWPVEAGLDLVPCLP